LVAEIGDETFKRVAENPLASLKMASKIARSARENRALFSQKANRKISRSLHQKARETSPIGRSRKSQMLEKNHKPSSILKIASLQYREKIESKDAKTKTNCSTSKKDAPRKFLNSDLLAVDGIGFRMVPKKI